MAHAYAISSHRTAGMYMLPRRLQSCAFERANRRVWDIGMSASAHGLALYVGKSDTLVRVDAPEGTERFAARPVLGMLDAQGGLADPLSRLRVAVLLRTDMPVEAVVDDLSPADAFDPLLSSRSRALLKGRALDATMIEGLFLARQNRDKLLHRTFESSQRYAVDFGPPLISRAVSATRILFENPNCWDDSLGTGTIRWQLTVQDVKGAGTTATRSLVADSAWVRLVTHTDTQSIAENCGVELQFLQTSDGSGRRVFHRYCEGGNAFKGTYDERNNRFDATFFRQPRWKP